MSLIIRSLGPSDASALLDFYLSLSDSVTRLFQPFDEINETTMRLHLEATSQGKHFSHRGKIPLDRLHFYFRSSLKATPMNGASC